MMKAGRNDNTYIGKKRQQNFDGCEENTEENSHSYQDKRFKRDRDQVRGGFRGRGGSRGGRGGFNGGRDQDKRGGRGGFRGERGGRGGRGGFRGRGGRGGFKGGRDQRRQNYFDVYICNLDYEVNEDDIKNIFSSFGEIKKIKLPKGDDGKLKGFGFVSFDNEDVAKSALTKDGENLKGRKIKVKMGIRKEKNESQRPEQREQKEDEKEPSTQDKKEEDQKRDENGW